MTSISKQIAINIIQKLIDEIPNLEKLKAGCNEYLRWRRDVETALLKIFPDDDRHLKDFKGILFSDPGPMFVVAGPNTRSTPLNHQPIYLRGLGRARVLLESIIAEIVTYWPDTPTVTTTDFWPLIHPEIANVTKTRFEAGHYADCAEAAFKKINEVVKEIVKKSTGKENDGAPLMREAFTPTKPIITIETLATESGKNVQQGFMEIFAGSMTGIRNPKAHAVIDIGKERAIHFIFLASLLMDTIDIANNKYRY